MRARALDVVRPAPVVGITTTTASYRSALATARAFKAVAPDALVVLGGHHASPQHDVILRHHADIVDAVVRGEGEHPLLAIARGLHPERCSAAVQPRLRRCSRINPPGALLSLEELDSLPVGFRSNASLRSAPGKFDHSTYVSARGCPLRCAFCAVAGQPIRAKSIDRVIPRPPPSGRGLRVHEDCYRRQFLRPEQGPRPEVVCCYRAPPAGPRHSVCLGLPDPRRIDVLARRAGGLRGSSL